MRYKDCTLNYWQKAEDFAASKGYDMVRFVMNENGHEIYNFLSKSMLGKKTGWSHYMDIDTNGDIIEVEDEDKIFFYRDEHCKQFERKKKSLSNIKDLTGKTIFDFATNDELADAGFPPDEKWYMDYLKERVSDDLRQLLWDLWAYSVHANLNEEKISEFDAARETIKQTVDRLL